MKIINKNITNVYLLNILIIINFIINYLTTEIKYLSIKEKINF